MRAEISGDNIVDKLLELLHLIPGLLQHLHIPALCTWMCVQYTHGLADCSTLCFVGTSRAEKSLRSVPLRNVT